MPFLRRFLKFLMSLMIVACLGVADLPRPCLGDGMGNACGPAACTCLKSCTCHLEHELAAYYASFPCCKVDDPAVAGGKSRPLPNLSLPLKQWDAIAPGVPMLQLASLPRTAIAHTAWTALTPAAVDLSIREKPPRLAA